MNCCDGWEGLPQPDQAERSPLSSWWWFCPRCRFGGGAGITFVDIFRDWWPRGKPEAVRHSLGEPPVWFQRCRRPLATTHLAGQEIWSPPPARPAPAEDARSPAGPSSPGLSCAVCVFLLHVFAEFRMTVQAASGSKAHMNLQGANIQRRECAFQQSQV